MASPWPFTVAIKMIDSAINDSYFDYESELFEK